MIDAIVVSRRCLFEICFADNRGASFRIRNVNDLDRNRFFMNNGDSVFEVVLVAFVDSVVSRMMSSSLRLMLLRRKKMRQPIRMLLPVLLQRVITAAEYRAV